MMAKMYRLQDFYDIFVLHEWATCWQKGPYDKIWKFENDAYFKNYIHIEPFLKIPMICHKR